MRRVGVDLRPDEVALTLSLFVYCFLIGVFQFSAKAVRQSTFIDSLGAINLPLAYFAVAIFAFPLLRFYSSLTERLEWRRVVSGTALFLAGGMVVSWWALSWPGDWIRFVLYVWLSISTVLAMSQFWLYANSLYDPRQARRLFGLLSAGGLLGGIVGGQVAALAARWDSRATLLLGGAMLVLVAVIVPVTERQRRRNGTASALFERGEEDARSVLQVIQGARLLQLISAVMLLGIIVGQIIDLQFNWVIEERTDDLAERTVLFGQLYSLMGLSGFLFQLLVTTRIHRRLGVGFAMKVLPSSVFMATVGLLLSAVLFPPAMIWILGGLKIGENGLRYSLDQSTRELLFVAVSDRDRRKVKAWIDVFVQRLGKALAAVLLLSITFGEQIQRWLSGVPQLAELAGALFSPLGASWMTLVVCVGWLASSVAARRHYVTALRESLVEESTDEGRERESERVDLADVTTLEVLMELLGSTDSSKVLRSVDLLTAYGRAHLVPPLLLYHDDPAVRRRTLGVLAQVGRRDALPLIEKLIGDDDPDVRADAIRALARLSGHAAPLLMQPRLRDPDLRVRSAAIACLANHDEPSLVAEAEAALVELLADEDRSVRLEAAKALEEIQEPRFQQHLVGLLYDRDVQVAREAIRAVARRVRRPSASPLYIPILISLLRDRRLKHSAREALVAYGEDVIPALVHFMNDEQEQIWVRRALPKTVARLGSASAQAALVGNLDARDLFLRRKVIEALLSLDLPLPDSLRRPVESRVEAECRCYLQALMQLLGVTSGDRLEIVAARVRWRGRESPTLLQRLLADRMEGHLENLFDLLALLAENVDISVVRRELQGSRRSYALEYLDSVLPPAMRRCALIVLDDLPLPDRLREARRALDLEVRGRIETLRELARAPRPGDETAPWIAAAALQTICLERESLLYDEIVRFSGLGDEEIHPLVRETAEWARRQIRV